jgi:hypothetical protein
MEVTSEINEVVTIALNNIILSSSCSMNDEFVKPIILKFIAWLDSQPKDTVTTIKSFAEMIKNQFPKYDLNYLLHEETFFEIVLWWQLGHPISEEKRFIEFSKKQHELPVLPEEFMNPN